MTLEEYKRAVRELRDVHNKPLVVSTRNTATASLVEVSTSSGFKLLSFNGHNNQYIHLNFITDQISKAMADILWEETLEYLDTPYADRQINSNIHQMELELPGLD